MTNRFSNFSGAYNEKITRFTIYIRKKGKKYQNIKKTSEKQKFVFQKFKVADSIPSRICNFWI